MPESLCRLCINPCNDCKSLYDEDGQKTETYEVALKYFDSMFLNAEHGIDHTVMCLECWHHIFDFHNFRQSVILAQAKLLKGDKLRKYVVQSMEKYDNRLTSTIVSNANDITIKQEDELNSLPEYEVNTNEIHYDIIVKEEVKFTPTLEESEGVEYPSKYNNIFVTDETEFMALEKSTLSITYEEYNNDSFDDNAKNSTDVSFASSLSVKAETGGSHWKDPTEKCSNAGNVEGDSENENLMDISEYELDSLDENDTSDDNESLNYEYKSKVKRTKNMHNEKELPANTISEIKSIKRKREEELDEFIAQWKSELECRICNESLSNYSILQEHFSLHHPSKECYLECCGIKLKRRGHLAEHVRLHVEPNAFKCKYCSKTCTRKRNLNYHMLKQHGINISKDESLKQPTFSSTTTNDQNDIAKECSDKKSLINVKRQNESHLHRKLAVQESDDLISQLYPILECSVCKEQCSTFSLLHAHFRKKHSTGDGYILCCQRKFVRRSKFQDHVRLHLNPKAFACELCGKFFSTKRNLDCHMNTHNRYLKIDIHNSKSTSKAVKMPSGMEAESSNNKLNRRKTVQELDDIIARWRPNLECVICKEPRSNFALLQQHFQEVHSDETCYITCCQLKFTGRHDIEEHIRLHNDPNAFMCEYCEKCFTSKRNLNRHLRTKHRS